MEKLPVSLAHFDVHCPHKGQLIISFVFFLAVNMTKLPNQKIELPLNCYKLTLMCH